MFYQRYLARRFVVQPLKIEGCRATPLAPGVPLDIWEFDVGRRIPPGWPKDITGSNIFSRPGVPLNDLTPEEIAYWLAWKEHSFFVLDFIGALRRLAEIAKEMGWRTEGLPAIRRVVYESEDYDETYECYLVDFSIYVDDTLVFLFGGEFSPKTCKVYRHRLGFAWDFWRTLTRTRQTGGGR